MFIMQASTRIGEFSEEETKKMETITIISKTVLYLAAMPLLLRNVTNFICKTRLKYRSVASLFWPSGYGKRRRSYAAVSAADIGKQRIVDRMITQYRYQGARVSQINPLEYDKAEAEIINPRAHGFDDSDMAREFITDIAGMGHARLSDIISKLHAVYCGSVAPEFMHINEHAKRHWLRERFEASRPRLSRERSLRLLNA